MPVVDALAEGRELRVAELALQSSDTQGIATDHSWSRLVTTVYSIIHPSNQPSICAGRAKMMMIHPSTLKASLLCPLLSALR
jgi:hypothetical protein